MHAGATLLLLLEPDAPPMDVAWSLPRLWWWEDDGGLPGPIAADFWEAMCDWVSDHVPELAGGLWFALAEDEEEGVKVVMPFAVYEHGIGAESQFDSSGEGIDEGEFTISVYDTTKSRAIQLAKDLRDTLKDAPLVFTDGVLLYLRPVRVYDATKESEPGPGGVNVFRSIVRLKYIIEISS